MDVTALMWDEAGRDLQEEQRELARSAALADAAGMLGPLVFRAATRQDLGHRMALAGRHLTAIAERRGYPLQMLQEDLVRRWELLREARAGQQAQADSDAQRTAAGEQVMDSSVAALAAHAARQNPQLPMGECLRLAAEAVNKHADAYPLAYESWGGVSDGPLTDRIKNWKPPALPGPGDGPGGEGEKTPTLPSPKRTAPDVTPTFSDAADAVTPSGNAGTRPAPTSFSDSEPPDEPISGPAAVAPGGFSDARPADSGSSSPAGPAPGATFSDTPSPAAPSPRRPSAPASPSFSDAAAPASPPSRPRGPVPGGFSNAGGA